MGRSISVRPDMGVRRTISSRRVQHDDAPHRRTLGADERSLRWDHRRVTRRTQGAVPYWWSAATNSRTGRRSPRTRHWAASTRSLSIPQAPAGRACHAASGAKRARAPPRRPPLTSNLNRRRRRDVHGDRTGVTTARSSSRSMTRRSGASAVRWCRNFSTVISAGRNRSRPTTRALTSARGGSITEQVDPPRPWIRRRPTSS
jgi:hypothetical protein